MSVLSLKADFKQHEKKMIHDMGLPDSFSHTVSEIYFPLAEKIQPLVKASNKPLLISINGAQGTGKSTLTAFLKLIFEVVFKLPTASFSLDDFYLTKSERKKLANDVHALLLTRGVPGTHDISLLDDVIQRLRSGKEATVPRFDKSIDDRYPSNQWIHQKPVKLIIFEGWCNQSPVQNDEQLLSPINKLEVEEDSSAVWRRYVNNQLHQYHKTVFSIAELTIMLKPPSFECIYEWRELQEDKLRKSENNSKLTVMNQEQVKKFIQHFERITRHTISTLPDEVDILLPMNSQHEIERIEIKNDE